MVWWRRKKLVRHAALAVLVLGAVLAGITWSQRTDQYVPGERTEGLTDILGRRLPPDRPPLKFVDVAAEAGLAMRHAPFERSNRIPEDMGSGVALGDVDGDGWVDVYLPNLSGSLEQCEAGLAPGTAPGRLYRNRGDGTFEDRTEQAGLGFSGLGNGACFADVDADGHLDLLLTAFGTCRLYRNRGDGTFEDVSERSGVSSFEGFWTGIAAGDPDRDGDVDFYVCGYVRYVESSGDAQRVSPQYDSDIPVLINPSAFDAERNLLLRNRGDGTFEEAAEVAGVANATGRSLGAVFADLSGDGWPDLYVANDVSDNALYVNGGDGTFRDATAQALVGDYRGAMGLAVEDFDQDGDFDLFITHWVAQENGLYANLSRNLGSEKAPGLFFMDEADRRGLGQIALDTVGWAAGFFDADNDGLRDLFVINGHTIPQREDRAHLIAQRSHLFWNAGPERGFFEIGPLVAPFFAEDWVGRGGATFDYDLDGDEDLLVVRYGESPVLLQNGGEADGGAVRVRLRQPEHNRFALGSLLRAEVDGRVCRVQTGTQGSYLSQHAVGEASFGLDGHAQLDRLTVTWPDGTSESAGPFAAGSLVTWTRSLEPRAELLPGLRQRLLRGPQSVEAKRRFFATLSRASDARVQGDWQAAVTEYRAALREWPTHEDSLYYLGNCLLALGDEAPALEAFQSLLEVNSQASRAWMQIGRVRLPGGDPELDDLDSAEEAFATVHGLNGEESGPLVLLGVVQVLRGDFEQAERWLADAATLNPRCVESRYWRGWIAWKTADPGSAQELLDSARELSGRKAAGDSVSNEGDTRGGGAMVDKDPYSLAPALERWRSVAERGGDAADEFTGLDLPEVAAADDV